MGRIMECYRSNIQKILIIKPRHIGDVLVSTPCIRALRKNFPKAYIAMVISPKTYDILSGNPNLDQIIIYDKTRLADFFKLIYKLRKFKFDLAVGLHATLRCGLIAFLAGIKYRIIHSHSGRKLFSNILLNVVEERKSAIKRDLDTLRPLGIETNDERLDIYISQRDRQFIEECLASRGVQQGELLIGFGPGARRPSKRWAIRNFAELGDLLIKRYGAKILIISGPGEEEIARNLSCSMSHPSIMINGFNLKQLAAVLEKCNVYMGNDSGPKHIAVAVGTPTVTLFGPEKLREWHPYKPEDGHIAIIKEVDCRGVGCPKMECDEHSCMKAINVEDVLKAIERVLSNFSPKREKSEVVSGPVR